MKNGLTLAIFHLLSDLDWFLSFAIKFDMMTMSKKQFFAIDHSKNSDKVQVPESGFCPRTGTGGGSQSSDSALRTWVVGYRIGHSPTLPTGRAGPSAGDSRGPRCQPPGNAVRLTTRVSRTNLFYVDLRFLSGGVG